MQVQEVVGGIKRRLAIRTTDGLVAGQLAPESGECLAHKEHVVTLLSKVPGRALQDLHRDFDWPPVLAREAKRPGQGDALVRLHEVDAMARSTGICRLAA